MAGMTPRQALALAHPYGGGPMPSELRRLAELPRRILATTVLAIDR